MPNPAPAVIVAIKVRPTGQRYDLLDAAANGALIAEIGPKVGDLTLPVPAALVSPDMNVHVRVRTVSGPIRVSVLAWSSARKDDPATPDDERWDAIGETQSGKDTLVFDDVFQPFPSKAPGGQP
jgi:hypothetical protein